MDRGLLKFDQRSGSASLRKHVEKHKAEQLLSSWLLKVSRSKKKFFYSACAYTVTLGHLPISFTQGSVGMSCVAKAIIDIGHMMQSSTDFHMLDLLQCGNTVRSAMSDVAAVHRRLQKHLIKISLEAEDAISYDGLTQGTTDRKYYDTVVHCVESRLGEHPRLTFQVLFIAKRTDGDTGSDIRGLNSKNLYEK